MKLYILSAVMLSLLSCALEPQGEKEVPSNQEDTEIVMALNAPFGTATRSLSDTHEEAVNSVNVLVFDKNDEFRYARAGQLMRDADNNVYFRAKLPVSDGADDKYRLVVVANAASLINSLFSGSQHVGTSYENVLKLLVYDLPSDPNPQANAALRSKGIPMWGEVSGKVTINRPVNNFSATMLRALAKIDVITNPNVPAPVDANGRVTTYQDLDNFSLEETYLYKGNSKLCIAPATGSYDSVNKVATKVTLPQSPAPFTGKLTYIGEGNGILRNPISGRGMAMTNLMYAAESDVNGPSGTGVYGDANHTNRMAVVVGGKYGGSDVITYYRIDFRTSQSAATLHDILRNHNYQLVINKVKSKGHSTPDEAYNSVESRIEANIIQWKDAGQKVIFDGQHRLVLSNDKLVVGSQGSNYNTSFLITVRSTNVDNPLTITGPHYVNGSNWLFEEMAIDGGGVGFDNELNANAISGFIFLQGAGDIGAVMENNTGSPREVYYLITSGNLTYKFRILQSGSPWLEANFSNSYLYNSSLHPFSVNALCDWNITINPTAGNNTSGGITPLMELRSTSGPAGTNVPGTFNSYDDSRNNPRKLASDNVRVTFSDPSGVNVNVPYVVSLVSPGMAVAPTLSPAVSYLSHEAGANSLASVSNPSGLTWTLSVEPGQNWLKLADSYSGAGAAAAKAGSGTAANYYLYAVSENSGSATRSTNVTLRCEGFPDVVMPVHQETGVVPHLAVLNPDHVFSLDGTTQTATIEYDHNWKISAISFDAGDAISNRTTLLSRKQTYTGSGGAYQTTTLSMDFIDNITGMLPGETPVTRTFTITFADQSTGRTVYVWEVKAEAIPKVFDNGLKVYPVDLVYEYGKWGWYDYSNTVDGTVNKQIPPNNAQVSPPRENSCAALYPQNTWRLPTSSEWEAVCKYIVDNGGPTRFNIPYTNSSSYYFAANTYGETGYDMDKRVEAIYFTYNTSTKVLSYGRTIYPKASKTTNGRGRCVRNF